MTLYEELTRRGLIAQVTDEKEISEMINNGKATFYIGFDPTADSLGVHHLIGLIAAKILQTHGHRPIILVGGATCAIGDPSGKSEERKAISMETVFHNVEKVKAQISKIVDFSSDAPNAAILVNNYDWYKDYKFLDFIRDVGKKITVNYLMAKENVRKRLEREGSGISFQEFSYGLLQGYDFVHLYNHYGCKVQIAGQDNLGNMVTGQDLLHKMQGADDVCGITWELVTCADGRKFGKTEGNTVWLDKEKTTPYEFYQFWLNQTDEDSERFIKMFTLIPLEEIDKLIAQHKENPSARVLQKELARYMTCMVHSEEEYNKAVEASNILFGKSTTEDLAKIDEPTFLAVMKGVSKVEVAKDDIKGGINVIDMAVLHNKVTSKSDARKLIKGNGFAINKNKVTDDKMTVNSDMLIDGKYLLLQKGKKEYTLVVAR